MARHNFTPFPTLLTERLLLRQPVASDIEAMFALRSDPVVNQYIGRTVPQSLADVQQHFDRITHNAQQNISILWALSLRGSTDLIGTICFWNLSPDGTTAEVGYEMFPAYHGQGLMDEALKAIVHYGFHDLHFTTLEAFTHHANTASIRMLERNHFVLDPDARDPDVPENRIYRRSR